MRNGRKLGMVVPINGRDLVGDVTSSGKGTSRAGEFDRIVDPELSYGLEC
jgi:hypothetical protein